MLDFDKICRVHLSVLPSHRDQAGFHSMYQNSNEAREMKKMSNVKVFCDIIESKVQTLFVNKLNSSLRNANFLQKQREPSTAIIIKNDGVLTSEDKEGWETGQEEDNYKQKQFF